MYRGRTPETMYVEKAFIKFRKIKGVVHYNISKWIDMKAISPEGIVNGIVKNEEQIKQFDKAESLKEWMQIHSLGSVTT